VGKINVKRIKVSLATTDLVPFALLQLLLFFAALGLLQQGEFRTLINRLFDYCPMRIATAIRVST